MKKIIILLLLSLLLLISCTAKEEKTILNVAISQEPPTFDVNKNSSLSSRMIIVGNVLEKALTLDSKGNVVPELCESYEMSTDAKSFTFKLREKVYFHDETELTSLEAVNSLNRWVESYAAANKAFGKSRFQVVDKYTFRVDFNSPYALLPQTMASSPQAAVIMSQKSLDSVDANGFLKEFIGTGPYRFDAWSLGQSVTLSSYEKYSPYGGDMDGLAGRKESNFEQIVYHFVPDATTRTLGLITGEYDFINDVMNDDIPRLRENKDLNIYRGSEAGSFVLVFNKAEGICSNQYIREAINTAVDFDQILASCYGSGGYTLHPNYMENEQVEWRVDNLEQYYNQKDLEKSKEILKTNGYDGTPIRILSPNLSNMDKSAVALQSELKKIGIKSELIITDWATFMNYRKDKSKYDIYITALTTVPTPALKLFLDPAYPGWSDDTQLQAMMNSFNTAISYEESYKIWENIQHYCYEYLPAIVLGHYLSGYGWNTKLENVNTFMGFYFWNSKLST